VADEAALPIWLTAACGERIETAKRARWGFYHETWLVRTEGGRELVAQRRVAGSIATGAAPAALRGLLRDAGVPVPEPVDAGIDESGRALVTMPLIQGVVAADLLADDRGAAPAGAVCGGVAAGLARLDPARIAATAPAWTALRGPWATGEHLVAATARWLDETRAWLSPGAEPGLRAIADRAAAETARRGARFAHGDLAPVNVLVAPGPGGDRLAAMLDLDRARIAHPGFDAAWFGWVLEHHHLEIAAAAMRGYAARCAGAETPHDASWLRPLILLELLAEAAGRHDVAARDRWATRVAAALA
jgi:Ser/Thr protein kinase RdoA (MazF antagonist)